MKTATLLFSFFSILLFLTASSVAEAKKSLDDSTTKSNDSTNDVLGGDGTIEDNPDYVEPDKDASDGDESDSEDDDDDVMLYDSTSVKSKIEFALAKSKKGYKKSLKMLKKNRSQITLVLAVFAFRREIRRTIIHILKNEIMDPKTGKLRVSPTSMLKFILFVDFMRRLQTGENASQPTFQALTTLGKSNPLFGVFFSRVMRVPMFNPAYIPPISQHYTFERINERYIKDGMALHKAIHAEHTGFKWPAAEAAITASMISDNNLPPKPKSNETVVILDLTDLDTTVSNMEQLRDQVSFLLSQYRTAAMMTPNNATSMEEISTLNRDLEVVVILESPGGSAADYGLAAQQLLRLREEAGVKLTICVDKVAASGGYMMACTATPGQLFAAPFAVVGSIGVLGQIVNVQKLLEGWGLSPMVFRGGKDKAPLGVIGEVTQDGKDKIQEMIDTTHKAFKEHVAKSRPSLKKSINKVGNGDVYIGTEAKSAGLIDRITTSDEYISMKVSEGARVLKLTTRNQKYRFPFGGASSGGAVTANFPMSLQTTLSRVWNNAAASLSGIGSLMQSSTLGQAVSAQPIPSTSIQ